ncbi:hypothetical protein OAG1_15620 [Agarivorans sp. OAG1]|uniref:IS3 family transposase n=1 Tax=Agarivorans sp. OAG1 TaxID=3082387 RepID=UPI002B292976|nr:hypothetical protein OAG1_15620 [Agarivorans sp. OAG1]
MSGFAGAPSGYYDRLKQPLSQQENADRKLLGQIKQFWIESGGHYDYRNIHKDLLEARITCGRDRVLRLMLKAALEAQRIYKSPKSCYGAKADIIAANTLNREFAVAEPNQ